MALNRPKVKKNNFYILHNKNKLPFYINKVYLNVLEFGEMRQCLNTL